MLLNAAAAANTPKLLPLITCVLLSLTLCVRARRAQCIVRVAHVCVCVCQANSAAIVCVGVGVGIVCAEA